MQINNILKYKFLFNIIYKLICTLFLVLVQINLSSCSSSSDSTNNGTDGSPIRYKTYSITLNPELPDEVKYNASTKKRIFSLIDTILQSKGYEKLDSNADLTVFPYIRHHYDPFDISGQNLPDTIKLNSLTTQSLIIDIVDSKTQQIIFRSVSSFTSPNSMLDWLEISRDIYVSLSTIAKTSIQIEILPDFPWPIPQPSTFYTVDTKYLINEMGVESFEDAKKILKSALDKKGYSEISYFRIRGGFVVVTRVEQIDENGFPKPSEERWVEGAQVKFPNNLLEVLFGQPRGYYRLFVFAISQIPFSANGKIINYDDVKGLLTKGWNYLTPDVFKTPFSKESMFTVLVYEYESRGKGNTPVFISESKLTAKQHLEKSKLLMEFTK